MFFVIIAVAAGFSHTLNLIIFILILVICLFIDFETGLYVTQVTSTSLHSEGWILSLYCYLSSAGIHKFTSLCLVYPVVGTELRNSCMLDKCSPN